MEENVIARPAIAQERRMLTARAARVAASAQSDALIEQAARHVDVDPHAACRDREHTLAEQVRREIELAYSADAESLRAKAREDGFAQGLRDGSERAIEEARAAEAARLLAVESLVETVRRAHEASLESARDGALAIGLAVACRILGEALVTREGVQAAVDQVLARTHATERVTVRLAPRDLALIDVEGSGAHERQIDFVADASMEPGGCFVDSSSGTLDGRLRTQIEALYGALCAARPGAGA